MHVSADCEGEANMLSRHDTSDDTSNRQARWQCVKYGPQTGGEEGRELNFPFSLTFSAMKDITAEIVDRKVGRVWFWVMV